MIDFLKEIKFAYVLALLVFLLLAIMYFNPMEAEGSMRILLVMVASFSSIVGFIFGKSLPDKEKE